MTQQSQPIASAQPKEPTATEYLGQIAKDIRTIRDWIVISIIGAGILLVVQFCLYLYSSL